MKIQYKYLILLFIFLTLSAPAQRLQGTVLSMNDKGSPGPLPGAIVHWLKTVVVTSTDSAGKFSILFPGTLPAKLIATYIGYQSDTLEIKDRSTTSIQFVLKNMISLKEVNVIGKKQTTTNSLLTPLNTELISKGELLKAACCNLSESFTTNASVDVAFADAVSGTKKIQMLGLDGIYTQVLSENIPILRGLSSSYGLNYIPGTWIESIQVTKGTGSVVNGYESITGQINMEFLKPTEVKDKLFLNVYGNEKGRIEGNLHLAKKFNDHWGSMLFMHASDAGMKNDMNGDGFLDMPLIRQYNIFNRWNYHSGKRLEAQLGVKGLLEERQGGQVNFNYDKDRGTNNAYGFGVITKQAEYFSKTGFLFPEAPYKSFGIMTSGRYHLQDSYFGLRKYSGEEVSFYGNGIYQSIFNNTNHKFKTGASFVFDDYRESFNDSAFKSREIVPGAFFEYTYSHREKLTVVSGIRADYHNLYGLMIDPRLHLKYDIAPLTAFRISAGRSFRTAHIFSDNTSVFASSRNIIIAKDLLPEIAWNYGASLTHKFKILEKESSINIDFFRTDFQNQVVVDREDVRTIKFYNLNGLSFSNALQADLSIELMERLDLKLAYKWYDVKTTYSGQLLSKPFVFRNRALTTISYATEYDVWKFDLTLTWFDKGRIPSTDANPVAYQLEEYTRPYFLLNGQITKTFKYFELYLGVENLLNFTQKSPILASNDPFGMYFDAGMVWGPLDGRVVYGGLRYAIK